MGPVIDMSIRNPYRQQARKPELQTNQSVERTRSLDNYGSTTISSSKLKSLNEREKQPSPRRMYVSSPLTRVLKRVPGS